MHIASGVHELEFTFSETTTRDHDTPPTTSQVFILLMIPAGGASLGFLGPAMGVAVAGTHPVSELYSSGAIELGIQVMGAVLTQLSSGSAGYTVLSVASWIIALIMIFGFAPPDDPDSDEVHSTHHQGARYEEVGMESGTASV